MAALLAKRGHAALSDTAPTTRYIYGNTAASSPLRTATVDLIVYVYEDIDLHDETWDSLLSEGGDFVVDLMIALKEHWKPRDIGL